MNTPLLTIDDLRVNFTTEAGEVEAVRGIDLRIKQGEFIGIVGESGSGKSVTALAAMGLLESNAKLVSGKISFFNQVMVDAEKPKKRFRPSKIAMIFQYPMVSLSPVRRVGLQIMDAIKVLEPGFSERTYREKALDLLDEVNIDDPTARFKAYPFELSGGMCQRILIAMALAREPHLLLADEPTTGLDVVTQETILGLLKEMQRKRSMSTMLITHDLGLASRYCDRICVMQHGKLIETGTTDEIFDNPQHPYTLKLINSTPGLIDSLEDFRRVVTMNEGVQA